MTPSPGRTTFTATSPISSAAGGGRHILTWIDSNLDNLISDKIKAIYGRKMEELKAQVKAELDARIKVEKDKLLAEANQKKAELLALVNGKLSDLQPDQFNVVLGILLAEGLGVHPDAH